MKAFGLTDVGIVREVNQDYIYYSVSPVGNLPNLFIVADGMGGHKAGDVASRTAVTIFTEYIAKASDENPITLIDEGIRLANDKIVRMAGSRDEYTGMGTTMVVAVILDERMYIANVGDSRLYLLGEEIKQITRDHSLVAEMVSMGELNKQNARYHKKKNIITRAVGGDIHVIPDFFEVEYHHGDRVLLCTDGLTNMVDDSTIRRIAAPPVALEKAVTRLIDRANDNGGRDNISALLIQTGEMC